MPAGLGGGIEAHAMLAPSCFGVASHAKVRTSPKDNFPFESSFEHASAARRPYISVRGGHPGDVRCCTWFKRRGGVTLPKYWRS